MVFNGGVGSSRGKVSEGNEGNSDELYFDVVDGLVLFEDLEKDWIVVGLGLGRVGDEDGEISCEESEELWWYLYWNVRWYFYMCL